MTDQSPNLSFRLASHDDYDAVIRMSKDIYGDTDYLPEFFHSLIDDPDTTVFLAVVGTQVVGLLVATITEEGKAFISTSARVAPAWRGKRVIGKLEQYQDAWIRQNRPAARYKRATASTASVFTRRHIKGMPEVFCMPYVEYKGGPNLWWRQNPAQLAQLDTTGLPDVVPLQTADDDFCTAVQKWLPDGACGGYDGKPIIIVDWDPFTLCPANLKILQAQNKIYMLNQKGEASLSLSNTYPTAAVRMMSVTIYAMDDSTVHKHLLKHLEDASRSYRNDVLQLSVFVGLAELEDPIHQFCRDTLQMENLLDRKSEVIMTESDIFSSHL
ncbi:histidine N-acetyltransferase-like isoform X2 [Branchiostoma floridae]|uniref:Histidine N-acetyltransferase-like isoform X2 n=1 Tax=Branchiostoma floridae TaxID=7739 RepID=A0A9J7HIE2_BRAFL|nr:histidine N-acetyltransferase-like isoform X2 [Branchiostoma floridae]